MYWTSESWCWGDAKIKIVFIMRVICTATDAEEISKTVTDKIIVSMNYWENYMIPIERLPKEVSTVSPIFILKIVI